MRLTSRATLLALMADKRHGPNGMSQSRLARYGGCSRGFINHLTTGRKNSCTEKLACDIAEALGVPVSVLFVRETSALGGRNIRPRNKVVA